MFIYVDRRKRHRPSRWIACLALSHQARSSIAMEDRCSVGATADPNRTPGAVAHWPVVRTQFARSQFDPRATRLKLFCDRPSATFRTIVPELRSRHAVRGRTCLVTLLLAAAARIVLRDRGQSRMASADLHHP